MDDNVNFAAPKRLAELKVVKGAENKEQQSLGKRKNFEDYQPSEGDILFEGPKPLSEILKRKREAEAAASGSGKLLVNKEDNNQREIKESLIGGSEITGVADTQSIKEESKSGTVTEKIDEAHGQSSQAPNNEFEAEDGMIYDETLEDQELEADDQRDGDYDYEQVDEEGEYNYEEGENADPEEEYLDEEEDGEDFAKKIGVVFS